MEHWKLSIIIFILGSVIVLCLVVGCKVRRCCPFWLSEKLGIFRERIYHSWRFLIAAKDLEPRDVIISEEPLITGPLDEPGNLPVCLGCCITLTENQFHSRCSKCRFPLCSETCHQVTVHVENECHVFVKNKVAYPHPHAKHVLNKSILILRCLLLKEQNPEKWEHLMTMSDNREFRRNRPNCITADERIVENFRKFLPSEMNKDVSWNEEQVYKLSGILDVNAHSFPVKVDGVVVASKCHVYCKTTLMAHSCRPNSSWAPDKSSESGLVIKTNVFVPRGGLLSVAYDDCNLLYGTIRRLIPMEMAGMFICKCERCLDPTEFGTYLSALKCQECPEGYLLSLNPTNSFSDWKCDNESCAAIVDEIDVSEIIEEAESIVGFPKKDLFSEIDDDVELLKEYIRDFGGPILHPNHYIILEVNLRIIKSISSALESMKDEDLKDYLDRCRILLYFADILTPGFCEYRAFLLYHSMQGLMELQERRKDRSKDDFNSCFLEETKKECRKENRADESHGKKPSVSVAYSFVRDELTDVLITYQIILKMQQEVYNFLVEKFTTGKRIDYVQEKMIFVKNEIEKLREKSTC